MELHDFAENGQGCFGERDETPVFLLFVDGQLATQGGVIAMIGRVIKAMQIRVDNVVGVGIVKEDVRQNKVCGARVTAVPHHTEHGRNRRKKNLYYR